MSEPNIKRGLRDHFDNRRQLARKYLLPAGPIVVLLAAAYFYFFSGRYVSTDNAYVKADKVAISAQVAGPISAVDVDENQHVNKGQVLFQIDDALFKLALKSADAKLASVRANIEGLKATFKEKQEELKLAQSDRKFAAREFQRQEDLARRHVTSASRRDAAQHNLDVADQQIQVIKQQLADVQAKLGGNPDLALDQNPQYLSAEAARDHAALDLAYTTVRAPFAGIASKTPEVGQYVTPGAPVMAVVSDRHMWIEANFKETELTHVLPGQSVSIDVDTYPDFTWKGVVESIAQATGAEFSVLPAQNATGNWVKVVQRIPVRIAVLPQKGAPQLRVGMSSEVEIDTHSGKKSEHK